MASIASVDVFEAVSRSARENEKSYDEALKEFLELFEHSLLNLDWIEANVDIKGAEFLSRASRQGVSKRQRKIQDRTRRPSRLDCEQLGNIRGNREEHSCCFEKTFS